MKKVIAFLLALMLLTFSSVCSAAPEQSRWQWVTSTDEVGVYIDRQTMNYNRYSNTVTAWVFYWYPSENSELLEQYEFNYDKRTFIILAILLRKDNEVIFSHTYTPYERTASPVYPDTLVEAEYEAAYFLSTGKNIRL